MYITVEMFCDLQDGGRRYRAGEEFPRSGVEVSAERIAELMGSANQRGRPLIKEVAEKRTESPVKSVSDDGGETVSQKAKTPQRSRKPRNKG